MKTTQQELTHPILIVYEIRNCNTKGTTNLILNIIILKNATANSSKEIGLYFYFVW